MKNHFLFAAIAVSAMFASCTEQPLDAGLNNEGEVGKTGITISFSGAESTRAVDTAEEDADSKINDLILFVVKNDGNTFDISPKYVTAAELTDNTTNGTKDYTLTATTDASKIYVVTNTGAFSTGAFKSVTNMTDVKNVVMKIDGNPNTSSNVKAQNVWMAGESTTLEDDGTTTLNGVTVNKKKADIQLN
jgi:hypothetical protein